MNIKRNLILELIVLSSLLFLVSCNKNKDEVIKFDETYPLALAPDVTWAVVSEPYAAYKKNADWAADIAGHCRRGEILQITGKSEVNGENWYCFENGWLAESSLTIYSNRFKAKAVSDSMKDK